MTYLEFLLYFIIPIILLETWYLVKSSHPNKLFIIRGTLVLIVLAVTYTTPWDNYLVKTSVWSYGEDRVIGTIGYVPIEEYCFFVLQTLMTGFWCFFVQTKLPISTSAIKNKSLKPLGILFLTLLTALGFYFLTIEKTRYLGLITAWATPILLLQWSVGGQYLLNNLRVFFWTFFPPSLYLWVADALAIHWNIWSISPLQTIGLNFWSLPFEEAVFFLFTNLMVAQGLILFVAMRHTLKDKKLLFFPIKKYR